MYLESSQIFQLSIALIGAILILIAAYAAPLKVSVGILLVMIPFQPIETRFGSANILMTYVLFGALLLRGRLRYLPMLGPLLLVLLAYLMSMGRLNSALYMDNALYIFFITSGLLVFVLAYNLAREVENPRYLINLLIASNIGAIIYCLVQFTVPPGERMIFFGMDELWMHRTRGGGDARLIGPFGSAEVTAAYFMSMTVLLAYEMLHAVRWQRVFLAVIAAVNIAMITGTASRGGFLLLIASLVAFVYVFRHQLGVMRVIQILVASTLVIVAAGIFIATHTEYGNMFNRLEATQVEGGIPDTRQKVWTDAWEVIQEKPWLGHGPFYLSEHTAERTGRSYHREQLIIEFPHNLYLHLLLSIGLLGLACLLHFLLVATWRIYKGTRVVADGVEYEQGLVWTGLVVVGGFLLHETVIEFLRAGTIDYVHFRFALFGIFLALADRVVLRARAEEGDTLPVQGKRSFQLFREPSAIMGPQFRVQRSDSTPDRECAKWRS
jgi:hypothetical protein